MPALPVPSTGVAIACTGQTGGRSGGEPPSQTPPSTWSASPLAAKGRSWSG